MPAGSRTSPPTAGDQPLVWDKLDYDTWRIQPAGAKSVSVRFDYLADTLDNAMAWARPELRAVQRHQRPALSGGPGPRLPRDGGDQDRAILARRHRHAGVPQQAGTYREGNYHDLVDKPFFVGRIDYDSTQVAGAWTRLATYPAGTAHGPGAGEAVGPDRQDDPGRGGGVPGDAVAALHGHDDLRLALTAAAARWSTPTRTSASTAPRSIGNPILASITAHEIFHAWNVKRLRPADMVPYRYDRTEPTVWLWVSEGITDYYADLALLRGGIVDRRSVSWPQRRTRSRRCAAAPPTALEDASLSTWIHPTDGSQYLYYPKGRSPGSCSTS